MKRSFSLFPFLLWMSLFVVVPLILVLVYAFQVDSLDGTTTLGLQNFARFFEPIYLRVMTRSFVLALLSTLVCFILGYPLALFLTDRKVNRSGLILILFVVPLWMNFLLRTYAWLTLLERNGIVNALLTGVGLPPLSILYTETAVVLGMVYNFLPFMILPIYSVLNKLHRSLFEAAEDLGANSMIVFFRIIFPLSLPGVVSGVLMVFMPAMTTFVISRLLGGGQFMLIGNLIEQQFLFVGDWGFGSAISVIMMGVILLSIAFLSRYEKEQGGRETLW